MKIAVMQPYFLPYIGYWQMINLVDKYVVFDDVNYINRGWINRNRILVNEEPHFINLSIMKASQNKLINELRINPDQEWRNKNIRMIELSYRKAPFYNEIMPLMEKIMYCEEENLAMYLFNSIKEVCGYLSIETEFELSSNISKDNSLKGQYKILEICEKLSAEEYYNAIGGQELYDYKIFSDKGIKLAFLKTDDIQYKQFKNEYNNNLSILDVLMFNSKEECTDLLHKFSLITR